MAQLRPSGAKALPPENMIYPSELFKMMCIAPDRETRIKMLQEYVAKDQNHAKVLQSIAELTWHPAVVWVLPEGAPPHTPASPHVSEAPSSLFRALRQASRFLKGGGGFIQNNVKREHYFAQILESLSEPEVKLLIAIKDKELSLLYPKVTLDLFAQVFPQWFPTELVQQNPPKEDTPDDPKKEASDTHTSQESETPVEKPARKSKGSVKERLEKMNGQ